MFFKCLYILYGWMDKDWDCLMDKLIWNILLFVIYCLICFIVCENFFLVNGVVYDLFLFWFSGE